MFKMLTGDTKHYKNKMTNNYFSNILMLFKLFNAKSLNINK